MSENLRRLATDPWLWLIVSGTVGIAIYTIRRSVRNAVDHQFTLRLAKHRHNLELIAETAKYELQRRLTGYGLYMQKQHAAAADVYAAIRIAHGAVSQLSGGRTVPDFTYSNEEDIRESLREDGVSRGKVDELLSDWVADGHRGSSAIVDYIIALDLPKAEAKQQEARYLMYLNEIYFSGATIEAFDHYVAVSSKWIIRRKFPPQPGESVEPLDRGALDNSLAGVRNAFRAELGDIRDRQSIDPADPAKQETSRAGPGGHPKVLHLWPGQNPPPLRRRGW